LLAALFTFPTKPLSVWLVRRLVAGERRAGLDLLRLWGRLAALPLPLDRAEPFAERPALLRLRPEADCARCEPPPPDRDAPLGFAFEPDPFDEPLARIVIRRTDVTTVTFTREDRDLILTGPAEHLHTVAHIFDESADQDGGGKNVHLDPFPGHHFLDERSASVILNDPGSARLGAAYRKWRAEQ